MKIGETFKGCNYWGYEPASGELKHAVGNLGIEGARKLRDQYKKEYRLLRDQNIKPSQMGFKSIKEASDAAQKIEDQTGIQMWVFNHDYI